MRRQGWERDDGLALFDGVRARERQKFLYPSNELDIEASLSKTKFGGLSRGNELLTSDTEKNDYDWLLTPPATPLFPLLDEDSPKLVAVHGQHSVASVTSRLSHSHEPSQKTVHRNPSPRRPSSACSTSSSTNTVFRRRSFSPSQSGTSLPSSTTAHGRSSPVPSRSSGYPVTRSSTHTLQRINTTPTIRSSRNRGKSLSPKVRPSTLSGFFAEVPPNLRTSISDPPTTTTVHLGFNGPRQGIAAASCFDVPASSRRKKRHSLSPSFSRSLLSSSLLDQNSSQTSKGSVCSSFEDDIEVVQSSRLDEDIHSLDHGFEDLPVSPRVEKSASDKYAAAAKRQSKSSGSPASNTLAGISTKKYSDSTLRHMDNRRNSQNMFRPLLSSVPTSSFYSIRPDVRHHRQSSELSPTVENTGGSASSFPNNERNDDSTEAQLMQGLSPEKLAQKFVSEEFEEEKVICGDMRHRLPNPASLDHETSSCSKVLNSCESLDGYGFNKVELGSSSNWKSEVLCDEKKWKNCTTEIEIRKQDSACDKSVCIDTEQDAGLLYPGEGNGDEDFRDILEDLSSGTPHQNSQDIKALKEKSGFQCFSEPPEAEVPIRSKLSREPRRATCFHQEQHSVSVLHGEFHPSNQRGDRYQENIKYHSTSHHMSKSGSFNSGKGHDLHMQEDKADLANRSQAFWEPLSSMATTSDLIPANQRAERQNDWTTVDSIMHVRRNNSVKMESSTHSQDGASNGDQEESSANRLTNHPNMSHRADLQEWATRKGPELSSSEGSCHQCVIDVPKGSLSSDSHYLEKSGPSEKFLFVLSGETPESSSSHSDLAVENPRFKMAGESQGSMQFSIPDFPMIGRLEQTDAERMECYHMDTHTTLMSGPSVEHQASNNINVTIDAEPMNATDVCMTSCAIDADAGQIHSSLGQLVDGITEQGMSASTDCDDNVLVSSSSKEVGDCVSTLSYSSETPAQSGLANESSDHNNIPANCLEQDAVPGAGDMNEKSPFQARPLSRSITLEEAADTILFCSSIVHDIVYRAAFIAMEKDEIAQAVTPIPAGELRLRSLRNFASDTVLTSGKRKGQNMAATSMVRRTLTYKKNQRASLESITIQQCPMDKTGNTIIGNEEEPTLHTPVKENEKNKIKTKVGCRCSCTIL